MYDRDEYIKQPVPINFELNLLFKRNKQITIFDIGACEGEDSVRYSRLFPESKIYAFEPLPKNIELIENNLVKYNIRNLSLLKKAVSCKDGFDHFYVSSGNPQNIKVADWDFGNKSSSLLAPSEYLEQNSFLDFKDKIEVETVTLKSFCGIHKISGIDFIHMDVQGAELLVLKGAEEFISFIKVIWLEVSKIDFYKDQPLVGDVKEFMKKNRFILLKDGLINEQGDQLYISKKYFSSFKILAIKAIIFLRSVAIDILSILKK